MSKRDREYVKPQPKEFLGQVAELNLAGGRRPREIAVEFAMSAVRQRSPNGIAACRP